MPQPHRRRTEPSPQDIRKALRQVFARRSPRAKEMNREYTELFSAIQEYADSRNLPCKLVVAALIEKGLPVLQEKRPTGLFARRLKD